MDDFGVPPLQEPPFNWKPWHVFHQQKWGCHQPTTIKGFSRYRAWDLSHIFSKTWYHWRNHTRIMRTINEIYYRWISYWSCNISLSLTIQNENKHHTATRRFPAHSVYCFSRPIRGFRCQSSRRMSCDCIHSASSAAEKNGDFSQLSLQGFRIC